MKLIIGILSLSFFSAVAIAECAEPVSKALASSAEVLSELSNRQTAEVPAWAATKTVLKIYAPNETTVLKQAIIVPPTGGENFLDRALARFLCKKGIYTLILTYDSSVPSQTKDLRVHDLSTEEFLAQLEKALRFSPRPTVLVGSSLGGLLSSVAFGIASQDGFTNGYPLAFAPTQMIAQIKGAVLTVAGGDLAAVLAHSQVPTVVQQRSLRTRNGQLSLHSYESDLRSAIRLDTLALANPRESQNILFFEGQLDTFVPTANQDMLWQAWGRPRRASFFLGHPETIFAVYEFRANVIRDFIRDL